MRVTEKSFTNNKKITQSLREVEWVMKRNLILFQVGNDLKDIKYSYKGRSRK